MAIESKRAEGAQVSLAASEIRFRRLFEAARDGILILDASTGEITDANPFLEENGAPTPVPTRAASTRTSTAPPRRSRVAIWAQ